jgi:N-acetylglutamate synthase-like GNAT family acetyltransferase
MPLPILQAHAEPTPDDLVRLFHRTELHWLRHLGDEAQLDGGVAFTSRELSTVVAANSMIDAALPPGASPSDVVEEVRRHFEEAGTTCQRWLLNPAAPEAQTRPLAEHLAAQGWTTQSSDILYLAGRPAASAAPPDGLTIIPARASFRHARQLAEQAAAEAGRPQLADASMLHLDDPHWDVMIALREGNAVARAGVLAVGEIGRLDQLYVSPPDRQLGVGGTMMARVLEVCARSLFRHVMVSSESGDSEGADLYAAWGFRRIGQMTAYVREGSGARGQG